MKKKYIKPSVKSIEIDEAVLTGISQPVIGGAKASSSRKRFDIDDYDF